VPSPVLPEPTPETRALVNSLVKLDLAGGPLSDEQVAAWKKNLKDLVDHGATAVPAIREFLARNVDLDFGAGGSQMLGYGSARAALIDALTQIGGPESVAALSGALQVTADPREVALLAQDLEKLEPGVHQQEAVDAARQSLEMASSRKLETADVAPLFEVLSKYGGSGAITELEHAATQWHYYGPIALGQLPDQAGVPTLVQMAQDPKASNWNRDTAQQMLALLSDQSSQARAALIEQARANGISEFGWRMMAPVLSGDSIGYVNSAFQDNQDLSHIAGYRATSTSDNQHFFSVPIAVSPDLATQRAALISDLLAATTDATGRQVLQQSRDTLSRRAPQVAALPGP
jgi:hypothetical protein